MENSERERIKKQIVENKNMRKFLVRLAGIDEDMIRVSGAPISNEKLRDLAFSRYFRFFTDKELKFKFTPIKIRKYFKDLKIVKLWNNLDNINNIAATANVALATADEAKNRAISLRYPPDELVTAIASRLSIHDSKIVSRTFIEQIQKKSKERRGEEQKRWDEHDGITGDEEYTTHLRAVPEYWKEEGQEFPCFFRGLDEEKENPKFINVAPTVHDDIVPLEDAMTSKGINSDKFRGVEDVDKGK